MPTKQRKDREWKPPPIFAVADEETFAFQQSEAQALKKKIYEHFHKAGVQITQTATATTVEQCIANELKRSENVSSVFLVNLGWIVDKFLQWKYLMPRVEPFYAVKSNPDRTILQTLKMLGSGFDCASEAELAAVKALGQASNNIIFANPCKGKSHIRYAKQNNVPMMTFDNPYEVDKIMAIYPDCKLVLRILPDDKYSLMPFGKKFGASWEESKILIQKCIDVKANLIGVSFHVGSGCFGTIAYKNALQLAHEVMEYAKSQGVKMTLLDIGGGFPGTDDEGLRFDEIAATVTPLLDEMFPKSSGIRIIGEPGRYFCSGTSTLAVIINSKRRKDLSASSSNDGALFSSDNDGTGDEEYHDDTDGEEDDRDTSRKLGTSASAPDMLELLDSQLNRMGLPGSVVDEDSTTDDEAATRNPRAVVSEKYEFLYYCSDGVYGSFNNIIFDHAAPQPVLLANKNESAEDSKHNLLLYKSRLFGPTCDSIDVICDCVELPELDIGDWLLFPNMGAYTVAAASSFNGFAPPNSTFILSFDTGDDV